MKVFIKAAFLCCLFSVCSYAQTSNASLGGTVSDATGALIPGVEITAANTATGIVTTAISNEAGAYSFPNLQTGTYRVSAELPGFQRQTYENVALGLSQQVRLNFTLQVASVATARARIGGAESWTHDAASTAPTLCATTAMSSIAMGNSCDKWRMNSSASRTIRPKLSA